MSAYAILCSSPACHRLALFRCSDCGRALCTRHALRVPAFGRASRMCAACQRRYSTGPRRLPLRRPFSQT
ncbi:MAG TPA: hypothetical protein VGF67_33300 [Ktedonobacteraceae bacterium]